MERPERFSLEWSEFESNLQNTFANLRREEHFSDVTLVSEDGHLVKAHKVLLSASSPLLNTILKSQDHPKPLIFMRGAKTNVLSSLLDFIYSGKVEIAGEQLDGFMALADELKVKGLSKDEKEASEEKVPTGNKKMKKTYKLGLDKDIGMTEKRTCNVIEEDKSDRTMKDEFINVSGNFDWENGKIKLLDCNLCEKTSTTPQGLERHKYRYHSARTEKIPAENEKGEFKSDKDVIDDLIGVSGNVDLEEEKMNLIDCNLCEKTSTTLGGLERHKYRYHSSTTEKIASTNLKTPVEHEGPVFFCNLCDATSRSKAGLYKHKIRHH